MKQFVLGVAALGLAFSNTGVAAAQVDEIVVTATKRQATAPGIFYETKGDFLLLEVQIENDSRGLGIRLDEISKTVDNFISAAKSDPEVELSIIDGEFVRPLSLDNFKAGVRPGTRPDTSIAFLKVKTQIPDSVEDSYRLASKLGNFVDRIEEVGRTTINAEDEISVSVLNPYQYRSTVIDMVIAEINDITSRLGPDYRVIVGGLDQGVKWVRSGDLNLAFYVPYEFQIYPTSINSFVVTDY